MQLKRNVISLAFVLAGLAAGSSAQAADQPMPVVATFSILGDLVKNVGGDRVTVDALVGPNGDAHVFSPSPADVRKVANAKLLFVNGLGLEGWMPRLAKSVGRKVPEVVATKGIKPIEGEEEEGGAGSHGHGHHDDPHAWQSVANAEIYVRNIRDGLIAADPAGKATYEANAEAYLAKLAALDAKVKTAMAAIPADRRVIVTTHDAFGYFAAAYGLKVLPPEGVSTESEASAKDVAKIIRQVKAEKIPAVFLENISDPRLMQQIAQETGAKVGAPVFSDALSPPDGPAPTYIAMIEHNIQAFSDALKP
jgi:zinc/manganese transport system substrate-binding protein